MEEKEVKAECGDCRGTGVFRGTVEPEGIGVVCLHCDGTGEITIKYRPFEGRKRRDDVKEVYLSRGHTLLGEGPTGKPISYEKFLNGKMPS